MTLPADDFLLPQSDRQLIELPSRRELRAQGAFFALFLAVLVGFELTTPEPFLRVMGAWMLTAAVAALAFWGLLFKLRSHAGTASPPLPQLAMVVMVYLASCAGPIGGVGYLSIDHLVKHSPLADEPAAWLAPWAVVCAVLAPVGDLMYRGWALRAAKRHQARDRQSAVARDADSQVAALERLAHQDALTGLPNRRAFERALERLAGGTEVYAVMFFDFDKFKPINDQFGHATGDAFLQEIASRLKSLLRATDFVARLGGDEFAVLVAGDAAQAIATRLADRFADLMQQPVVCGPVSLRSSASIGIAVARPDGSPSDAIVHQADLAMYEAKRAGGARYCVAGSEATPV